MNFYELKAKLNFPQLCGAIRLKSDLLALMHLNEEAAGRLFDLDMLMSLNRREGERPYEIEIESVLQKMYAQHKEDVATIKRYLIQNKMIE